MSELNSFAGGVLFGGFVVAWAINYLKERRPPKVEIKVTADVLNQVTSKMVTAWLDQRGLVWMPKGMEHIAKGEKP